MKADWYFDFISPYSYLQLEPIRTLHARLEITPIPIVFGAVLKHHGQLGPAEIRAAGRRACLTGSRPSRHAIEGDEVLVLERDAGSGHVLLEVGH